MLYVPELCAKNWNSVRISCIEFFFYYLLVISTGALNNLYTYFSYSYFLIIKIVRKNECVN